MKLTNGKTVLAALLLCGLAGGSAYAETYESRQTPSSDVDYADDTFSGAHYQQAATTVYGGALYNDGHTINITGGSFTGNSVTNSGGTGTSSSGTTVDYTSSISGYGGAIYNTSDGVMSINGTTFQENYTDYRGGAIGNAGTITTIENAFFKGNYTTGLSHATSATPSTNAHGGAIYNSGTIGVKDDDGSVSGGITNVEFTGNNVPGSGGAIYNTGASAVIGEITKSTFSGNEAGASGGAIYVASGSIGSVSDTTFTENVAASYGGAIYNAGTIGVEADDDSVSGGISGVSFKENAADASGGAIYNASGTIGAIDEGSSFTSNTTANYGGAIYNAGSIGLVDGAVFTENKTTGTGTTYGGAIHNGTFSSDTYVGKIDAIANSVFTSNESQNGGAISNYSSGNTIGELSNDAFEGNAASLYGGAIYNSGVIGETDEDGELTGEGGISGGSFAKNTAGNAGGAIYNTNAIASIDGASFTENAAEGSHGGAIYNNGSNSKIDSLTNSSFSENTAAENGGAIQNAGGAIGEISGVSFASNSAGGDGGAVSNTGEITTISNSSFTENSAGQYGGAVRNAGTIETVSSSSFTDNSAVSEDGDAAGGAIYNTGTIGTIDADFSGNSAEGATGAYGGAIYNENADAAITLTGSLTDNSAVSSGGEALGGAVYTTGDVNVVSDGNDILISGNSVSGTNGSESNAFYVASEDAILTFSASNGGTITLEDAVDGVEGYKFVVEGDGTSSTVAVLNEIKGTPDFSVGNVTLSTIDGKVRTYSVNSFSLASDAGMVADVDLENETMDRFTAGTYDVQGTLTVSDMNLISDTTADSVAVYFAEPELMNNVVSAVGTLPGEAQTTVYSPVYEYELEYLTYDESYDGEYDPEMFGENGGYFVFNKTNKNNPAVMISSMAQVGAYNAMNMLFMYNFEHSDAYMKLPRKARIADGGEGETHEANELTKKGPWVKPFFAEDSVSYRGSYSSRDKYYGALVGMDSSLLESDSGWAAVFSGYVGYMGMRQSYSGGNIDQRGGVVGATANLYKDDFFASLTAAFSSMKANGHTMYGREYTHSDVYGVAAKTGWNFSTEDGLFAVLPTFMAAYTYVDTKDYNNAAGVRIDSRGMHAIQLHPNVKFVLNLDDGWQPYLTAGEVWTVGQNGATYADGDRLAEELSLKPYTEYGGGIQKRWEAIDCDTYLEVLGHAGGRRGVSATAGLRWAF